MRVMVKLLAPSVEHGEAPDLRAQMFGIPGDVLQRLHHGAQGQAVEYTRVLEVQGAEDVRQRKDHMDVGDVEPLAFLGSEPSHLRRPVALGAVAISTGVKAATEKFESKRLCFAKRIHGLQ
jgi:hypothetical protein